jgi:hypothetical protein
VIELGVKSSIFFFFFFLNSSIVLPLGFKAVTLQGCGRPIKLSTSFYAAFLKIKMGQR